MVWYAMLWHGRSFTPWHVKRQKELHSSLNSYHTWCTISQRKAATILWNALLASRQIVSGVTRAITVRTFMLTTIVWKATLRSLLLNKNNKNII